MEVKILAKSMKPHDIYSLVSQPRCFVQSSSRTLSVLTARKKNYTTLSFYQKNNYHKEAQ